MNDEFTPEWLDTDWLLGQFGRQRGATRLAYRAFVLQGIGLASPLLQTKHQLFLGDEEQFSRHPAQKAIN